MENIHVYDAFRNPTDEEITNGIEVIWAGNYKCLPEYSVRKAEERYMLIYIVEGECTLKSPYQQSVELSQGSIVLFRPFDEKWIESANDQPLHYLGLSFSGEKVEEVLRMRNLDELCCEEIGISETIISLINEMITDILIERNYLFIFGTLLRIFSEIDEMVDRKAHMPQDSVISRLEKAVTHMKIHYNRKLYIKELAALTGYSIPRFQALMKQVYGMSTVEFLMRERISKAKDLLKQTSFPIRDIGYAVGFNDQYYFSKTFKEKTGVSPREYRKKHQNLIYA